MSITQFSIEKKTLTYFTLFLILVVGTVSYFRLGQLEDPDFTVKTALILTQYPGASPLEVEQEVTDRIETAVQEMTQLRFITSYSHAGLSIIKVEILQEYWADRLPQVWDQLRSKVRDVRRFLPPGVQEPKVVDDFSFVYGFVLAVTGEGLSYGQLEEYVKFIRKELVLVDGVARVETWGTQPKVIYLDASEEKLMRLGVTAEDFLVTLNVQNMVIDAGRLNVGPDRMRIAVTGEFSSPEDIGNLKIRTSLLDKFADVAAEKQELVSKARTGPTDRKSDYIALKDIVDVRMGYLDPAITKMRYDGEQAIGLSIANITGGNIIDTGNNLKEKLKRIEAELPVGIEIHEVAWQSELVTAAIGDFMINLLEAVVIVLVILTVFMGWRMGIIIGGALILTILGTFIFMAIMKIDLQRVSLGAIVIALGMMVDNAIVVADGMVVRLNRGMDRTKAAIEAASQPSYPLLGATIVAVMAFYPIYSAKADAGEYAGSLFVVVGISLLLSWLIAVTITPVMCIDLIKRKTGGGDVDPYKGIFFVVFSKLVSSAIKYRWLTVGGMVILLASSVYNFKSVERVFFTDATRHQFMIDIWSPEGSRIEEVSAVAKRFEEKLDGDSRVKGTANFMGAGGPRFYLPLDPELPYQSYGQIIVNTASLADVDALIADLSPWVDENVPDALIRLRKYTAGPGNTWQFEARFSGPARADLNVLRSLAAQGEAILENSNAAREIRTDMRQRVKKISPQYNQVTGAWTAVTRGDVAQATRFAFDGTPVGLYRQDEDIIPIILRRNEEERQRVAENFELIQIKPALSIKSLPLAAVTDGVKIEVEDPTIVHWNRRRAVTVQASPDGVTLPALLEKVQADFEKIPLPVGYKLEWRGEAFSTLDSQESLKPGAAPSALIMILIIVALFNAIRPTLIILAVIPFALIGVTYGLLGFNQPFSFMALLGAMSLVGMMIKNSIVLLDEIKLNITNGLAPHDATVTAAVSRVRPVVLAAATTVLGVLPLVQDIFWVAMATTIAAGLTFGTILTMILVPVFYAIFHNVKAPKPQT